MESCNIWFATDFFHLMFLRFIQVVAYHQYLFFLLSNNILFYEFTTFKKIVHQLMNIWVYHDLWLSWIMMLWTLVYNFLCEQMFCFFWRYTKTEICNVEISIHSLYFHIAHSVFFTLPTVYFSRILLIVMSPNLWNSSTLQIYFTCYKFIQQNEFCISYYIGCWRYKIS